MQTTACNGRDSGLVRVDRVSVSEELPTLADLVGDRITARDMGADECASCGFLFFDLADGQCPTCRR